MSFAIHKFPLEIVGNTTLAIDPNAKPLCVQLQDGVPTLWAQVDTGATRSVRVVERIGTGWPIPRLDNTYRYLGTVQTGPLVWHYVLRGANEEGDPA